MSYEMVIDKIINDIIVMKDLNYAMDEQDTSSLLKELDRADLSTFFQLYWISQIIKTGK